MSSSVVDRAKKLVRLLKRRSRPLETPPVGITGPGLFANAHNFTISGSYFIDSHEVRMDYTDDVVSDREAVFELLEPYTCLDATNDSSARHPLPRCHPETRVTIRERLTQWLFDEHDEWKMFWVRGYAGTGKSAVAQSFGDYCRGAERHGASYFFSRTAGRNKPETVVPTIVYQLARTIPEYRSFIEHQLVNNPILLRKSLPVQFRELIIRPFASLQRQHPRPPIVIVLDGLDECEGEHAQRDILETITNAIRSNPDLPLRWLIFSRPEAHLNSAFSRNLLCGREELVIDAECHEDVERYVKNRLVEIRGAYSDITPRDWPSPDVLQELLDAISGLFVFASKCLNFIADPDEAHPPSQLDSLLAFTRRSQSVVFRNPLVNLDLLYSQILDKVRPTVYGTTRRILAYMTHKEKLDKYGLLDSAQALSNFLQLDQRAFYQAIRELHSVVRIPEPEDASNSQLQFFHQSFQDFFLDPNRSGKFSISEQDAVVDIVQLGVHWYEVDATHFHTSDSSGCVRDHKHDGLPNLSWASEDGRLSSSQSITSFLDLNIFAPEFDSKLDFIGQDFLRQLSDIDFGYWYPQHVFLLTRLCQLDPSTSIIRAEPSSPVDRRLLEYFNQVIGNGVATPAKFPLRYDLSDDECIREYFFIGTDAKSIIVWRTKSRTSAVGSVFSLRCDQEPSEAQVSEHREFLQSIAWGENSAELKTT